MSPQQMDELLAMEELRPRDNGWTQTAIIVSTLQNELASLKRVVLNFVGGDARKVHFSKPEDFLPAGMKSKQKKKVATPDQVFRSLKHGAHR